MDILTEIFPDNPSLPFWANQMHSENFSGDFTTLTREQS